MSDESQERKAMISVYYAELKDLHIVRKPNTAPMVRKMDYDTQAETIESLNKKIKDMEKQIIALVTELSK